MAYRTYTDEQFIEAVRGATSLKEIAGKLNLKYGGYQSKKFRLDIQRLEIDDKNIKRITDYIPQTKICLGPCGLEKDLEEFHRSSVAKDGRGHWCKICGSTRAREYFRDKHESPLSRRKRYLKKKYNLSIEDYEKMMEAQNGVCLICFTPPKGNYLYIDHDHKCCDGYISCGECIRGLLCNDCNRGIGLLKESDAVIARALEYLRGAGNT